MYKVGDGGVSVSGGEEDEEEGDQEPRRNKKNVQQN